MSEDNTPAEEIAAMDDEAETGQVAALKAEAAALKEQILRYAAEAENTRRRAEREANDARAYAIQKFAKDLLGVADNLARALTAQPADTGDSAVKNFVVGVELTEKELQGAFERNGLKRIDPPKGEKFDPHKHQAMMEQPGSDVAPGGVIQVLQPGYELLGRLIRPAMVVVAAKVAGARPNGGDAPAGNPYAANEEGEGGSGPGGAFDKRA
jgi:molecular chaperone GrpE